MNQGYCYTWDIAIHEAEKFKALSNNFTAGQPNTKYLVVCFSNAITQQFKIGPQSLLLLNRVQIFKTL